MNTTAFGKARMEELTSKSRRASEKQSWRSRSVDSNSTTSRNRLERTKHRWTASPETTVARVAQGSMTDRGQIR